VTQFQVGNRIDSWTYVAFVDCSDAFTGSRVRSFVESGKFQDSKSKVNGFSWLLYT